MTHLLDVLIYLLSAAKLFPFDERHWIKLTHTGVESVSPAVALHTGGLCLCVAVKPPTEYIGLSSQCQITQVT